MENVKEWLLEIGLESGSIFMESFAPASQTAEIEGGKSWKISVPAFGKTLDIGEGQSLLDVLEKGGIPIIGACRSGMCGSCKCKVSSGKIRIHKHRSPDTGRNRIRLRPLMQHKARKRYRS